METCQETVPEAITAFMEGQNFEDVIRTAVSLGGDCDTLTCIACSMEEAFYSIAFPAISTGVYSYSKMEAAFIALSEISKWLSKNSDYGIAVVIVCYDQDMRD